MPKIAYYNLQQNMENSNSQQKYDHQMHQQSQSQCPECGNRYSESSSSGASQQSQSGSQQRIMIPLHKDLFQQTSNNTNQNAVDQMLKNLQKQIEDLKRVNHEKDRMLEDIKKQMDHKMTHYMLYGQLNKQNDEINRLRNQMLRSQISPKKIQKQYFPQSQHVKFDKIPSPKQINKNACISLDGSNSFGKDFNLQSTYKIAGQHNQAEPSKQSKKYRNSSPELFSMPKKLNTQRSPASMNTNKINTDYFHSSQPVFKISEAKKYILNLQTIIKRYEQQLLWLHNFASVFVKTIQKISSKKYGEQIVMGRWNLKKRVKVSWRYLKHLLAYLHADPEN